eukprot:CAMPEP_0170526158 /NCGR_PEP_ID=MMETSP0209-20121228/11621_1 /TAXON_ID=665100 ORGANISM="Litonotus pictus, Strain P1" /NCGR_SAMPLE_ID=MMETSP0209 /ASSEMBLY_ACC=CAM_ASM_000301 /LENGTH=274 /DNA_ID=CAMNT_0010815851 /DNA_START=318 /DNA_END=1138 /DNA_ORIENTATION=+
MGLAFMTLGIIMLVPCIVQFQFFGPISDVCLGVNNMIKSEPEIIQEINSLDIAGNTISALVKGFSTGLAGIVSFSLFGAIIQTTGFKEINLHEMSSICNLMFGGLFCYVINSYCLSTTATNAVNLIQESIVQIKKNLKLEEVMHHKHRINPDYFECIQMSAEYSFEKTVIIVSVTCLVILLQALEKSSLIPMITGMIISGIPLAISSSNSGSAWDNSKKAIEHNFSRYYRRNSKDAIEVQRRMSMNIANVGDNVGDAMKDISGPSITILIKFSA